MNKNLLLFGIAYLLICIGLSGCFENTDSNEYSNSIKQYVEFYDINVTTEWYKDGSRHTKSGFYDYPQDATDIYHTINIKVRNVANKPINYLEFYCNFYDSKGNFLCKCSYELSHNLSINESDNFTITFVDGIGHNCGCTNFIKYAKDYSFKVKNIIFYEE